MIIIDGFKLLEKKAIMLPRNSELVHFARQNRKGYNLAETVFWMHVNKKKFYGIDFTRQFVIGNFIVDFYIRKLQIVIEIDGGSHNDKFEYDKKRENFLTNLGLKVFRTTDWDVMHNLDIVLGDLKQFILDHCEKGEV